MNVFIKVILLSSTNFDRMSMNRFMRGSSCVDCTHLGNEGARLMFKCVEIESFTRGDRNTESVGSCFGNTCSISLISLLNSLLFSVIYTF
jgi:hypothetical protein